MKQQLYSSIKKLTSAKSDTEQSGKLGNFAGTVKVPSRPNYVYVRLSDNTVAECWNVRVPPIPNLNVLVDINPRKKTELMITDIMLGQYQKGSLQFVALPGHGETHTWPEYDSVYINYRQILPLRVTSAGGLNIQVNGGWYLDASGIVNWYDGETSVSLSSYVPASGSKIVTVSLAPNGTLTYTEGDTVSQLDFAWKTQTPKPPNNNYPLAAIRLSTGKSIIYDTDTNNNDIQDLRFVPIRASAGSEAIWGGITGNLANQTDLYSILLDLQADVSGLQIEVDTKVEEAPIDGNRYVRRNAAWEEVDNQIIDDLTPQVDSTGSTFSLFAAYEIESVFWNGQRLYEDQYTDATGTVVMDFVPEVGDTLVVSGKSDAISVLGVEDAPSDGKVYGRKNAAWEEVSGGGFSNYILLREQKSGFVDNDGLTSGAWRKRPINTEVVDTANLCTLSSNQITLLAGTYRCRIRVPGYFVGNHQARLYNVSDSVEVDVGTSEKCGTEASTSTTSEIITRFTIASSKTFEIQHRCSDTNSSNGMGVGVSWSNTQVWAIAEFWKE